MSVTEKPPEVEPAPTRSAKWFPEVLVAKLSDAFSESKGARTVRENALHTFRGLPVETDPLYKKYAHLGDIDLSSLDPLRTGPALSVPAPGPRELVILHDSQGTHVALGGGLEGKGIQIQTLKELLTSEGEKTDAFLTAGKPLEDKFSAMNLALATHGFQFSLPDAFVGPVRLREVSVLTEEAQGIAVRRSIRAGRRCSLFHSEEVYSSVPSQAQRLYSSSTSIAAADDSEVVSFISHASDGNTVSFYNRHLSTSTNAHVYWIFSGLDGFRTTLRNTSSLDQRGAEVTDLEVFYGDGHQSCASMVRVNHEAPDTRGQSIARGVFKDHARGTFTGMMRIDPSVNKVYSYLSEHAMLLSRTARAETAPGMEILSSNDVKAAHSSSVSPIDLEKIFYIESRGIEGPRATRMIVEGFLSSALTKCPLGGMEGALSALIDSRWNGRTVPWDGKGLAEALKPAGAAWHESGDVRLDEKLR